VLPLSAIDPASIRPLKRVEYDRLVHLGVFEDERVELLYGTIVRMSPINEPHNDAMARLTELLVLALHTRARLRPASSFAAGEYSQPEPDLLLVERKKFEGRPDRAFLVIEISESSLSTDRKIKKNLYAESGVPEYWIVNLVNRRIEVYDTIVDARYSRSTLYGPGESIRIGAFPDVTIAVDDVIV
jgi:Uma2 family endonuclease